MKSFVANTTINFEGYKFYVRPGDMLSYDPKHGNSLTVYRNGQIAKVIKVVPLVIEAFLKSRFLSEVKVPSKTIGAAVIPVAAAEKVAKSLHLGGDLDTENHREQMKDFRKQYDEQHLPDPVEKAPKRRKKGEALTSPENPETVDTSSQEAMENSLSSS